MSQKRRVVLKYQTSNIECVWADRAIDVVPTILIELVDHENAAVSLLVQNGRGDEAADTGAENDGIESFSRSRIIER